MLQTYDGIPFAAAVARGDPAAPVGSTTINGHKGWVHETPDGQRWFVPDAVGQALHRSSHDCPGGCPALAGHTDWSEP